LGFDSSAICGQPIFATALLPFACKLGVDQPAAAKLHQWIS